MTMTMTMTMRHPETDPETQTETAPVLPVGRRRAAMGLPRLEAHERDQLRALDRALGDAYAGRPDHDDLGDAMIALADMVRGELDDDAGKTRAGLRRMGRIILRLRCREDALLDGRS